MQTKVVCMWVHACVAACMTAYTACHSPKKSIPDLLTAAVMRLARAGYKVGTTTSIAPQAYAIAHTAACRTCQLLLHTLELADHRLALLVQLLQPALTHLQGEHEQNSRTPQQMNQSLHTCSCQQLPVLTKPELYVSTCLTHTLLHF
jgi:hypothetical protein